MNRKYVRATLNATSYGAREREEVFSANVTSQPFRKPKTIETTRCCCYLWTSYFIRFAAAAAAIASSINLLKFIEKNVNHFETMCSFSKWLR
jgi:hypothetical protein